MLDTDDSVVVGSEKNLSKIKKMKIWGFLMLQKIDYFGVLTEPQISKPLGDR